MKVFIKGKRDIDLGKNDYIASGGFGDIYAKNSIAYKIYQNPSNMIPEAKIFELKSLTNPNIIKPEDVLLDKADKPIGYTMRYLTDTYALCQLFPKTFRTRNNVTNDNIVKLVQKMQQTISEIHNSNILIVDLNEMNFLVNNKFDDIYFIDVDSYQTNSFPANALMETVRDRHSSVFTKNTDWFSFAIVSYQMFRGIHPYKGKHPKYSSLDDRMINNISIHNPDVSYPKGPVYPIDVIPQNYQDWYKAILDDGKRLPPPTGLMAVVNIITTQVKSFVGKLFDVIDSTLFTNKTLEGEVLNIYTSGGYTICSTTESVYTNKGLYVKSKPNTKICFSPKENIPYALWIDNGHIQGITLDNNQKVNILTRYIAESMTEYDNRIYFKYLSNIFEISYIGNSISANMIANVMERSTQLYSGCAVQNILGTYYVNVFPKKGENFQIKLPELSSSQVIDAKYDNRVLMIVASKEGVYDRHIFVFNENLSRYEYRRIKDVNYSEINFVTLPQGICACVNEDGSMDVFHINHPNNIKNMKDDIISDITLLKHHNEIMFSKNGKLYQLKTK